MDEDKAFEELENIEKEKTAFGLEAETFILNANKRHKVVTFASTEIRVKPAVPRSSALKIAKLQSRTMKKVKSFGGIDESNIDVDALEEIDFSEELSTIAECLSEICIDEPFSKKEFWEYFEDQTGQLGEAYKTIIKSVYDSEKEIIEFR